MRSRTIHVGDAAEVLTTFPDECVHLTYIDPPFHTGKDWGEFDDRWSGRAEFVQAMRRIAAEVRRVLVPGGSLYWQGDDNATHVIWAMLEDVFQEPVRRSIAWEGSSESGFKTGTTNWVRSHDTILYFTKGRAQAFNTQYRPYTKERLAHFSHVDENGRRFQRRFDRVGERRLDYPPDPTKEGAYRQYLDESKGTPAGSVWRDFFAPTHGERTGYPTQKPTALLDRIVRASSNEGDLVLDPCCGSGTTLVAAERLGRRWVGIDRNPEAAKVAEARVRPEVESNALLDDGPPVSVRGC